MGHHFLEPSTAKKGNICLGLTVTLLASISFDNYRLKDVNCITNTEIFLDQLYSCYRKRGSVKVCVHGSAALWQLETARLERVAAPLLCLQGVSANAGSVCFLMCLNFTAFLMRALQNANSDSFSMKSCL